MQNVYKIKVFKVFIFLNNSFDYFKIKYYVAKTSIVNKVNNENCYFNRKLSGSYQLFRIYIIRTIFIWHS